MSKRIPRSLLRQRQTLLEQSRELVPRIARRYALASPEPLDDLLQVGMLGLLKAADRYSPDETVPFDCFARPHIRGAILHHLRDRAWLVRLPRRQAEQQYRSLGASEAVDASPKPTSDALRRWAAMVRPLCLEELAESATAVLEALQSQTSDEPGENAIDYCPALMHPSWELGSTGELLALLERRQRRVVELVILQGCSYRQAAVKLKVSAPTVQRLLHKGLAQLRCTLQQRRIIDRRPRRAPSAAAGC